MFSVAGAACGADCVAICDGGVSVDAAPCQRLPRPGRPRLGPAAFSGARALARGVPGIGELGRPAPPLARVGSADDCVGFADEGGACSRRRVASSDGQRYRSIENLNEIAAEERHAGRCC